MDKLGDFELRKWIEGKTNEAAVVAAGSTGASMTLTALKAISTDQQATSAALSFDDLPLNPGAISEESLAQRVAALYGQTKAPVTSDNVLITNATTGANSTVFQALLRPGDHVISTFPVYTSLVEIPRFIGADVSLLHIRAEDNWELDIDALRSLLRPTTKMIVLNNPHNPTGSLIPTSKQAEIVALAAERDITIFCDEIFRPLFHTDHKPTSLLEHASSTYDKIVATGSLSKSFGFPGIRIGWIITRNAQLYEQMFRFRDWMLEDVSVVDKVIAKEVLSERCCANILAKNIGYARANLEGLGRFVKAHEGAVTCVLPTGGATAFVRFLRRETGRPVDDVAFCQQLLKETGLLVSPGTLGFGPDPEGAIRGYTRVHITLPPVEFRRTIERLTKFLASDTFAALT